MNDSECFTEDNQNDSCELDCTILKILESSQSSSSSSNEISEIMAETNFPLKKPKNNYQSQSKNLELMQLQSQKISDETLQMGHQRFQFKSNVIMANRFPYNSFKGDFNNPMSSQKASSIYRTSPLNMNRPLQPEYQPLQNSYNFKLWQDSTCTGESTSAKQLDSPSFSTLQLQKNQPQSYSKSSMKAETRTPNPTYAGAFSNQIPQPQYQSSHLFYTQNLASNYAFNSLSNLNFAKNLTVNLQGNPNNFKMSNTCSFKNARINSNYESMPLEDIINHIPYLCLEQSGCRFLQEKIEVIPNFAEGIVLPSLYPNLIEYSTNQFGNYLIQKIIDYSSPEALMKVSYIVSSSITSLD